jgi:hypothetical protein
MCRTHVLCLEWPPVSSLTHSGLNLLAYCMELRLWPIETYAERYEMRNNVSRDRITFSDVITWVVKKLMSYLTQSAGWIDSFPKTFSKAKRTEWKITNARPLMENWKHLFVVDWWLFYVLISFYDCADEWRHLPFPITSFEFGAWFESFESSADSLSCLPFPVPTQFPFFFHARLRTRKKSCFFRPLDVMASTSRNIRLSCRRVRRQNVNGSLMSAKKARGREN